MNKIMNGQIDIYTHGVILAKRQSKNSDIINLLRSCLPPKIRIVKKIMLNTDILLSFMGVLCS